MITAVAVAVIVLTILIPLALWALVLGMEWVHVFRPLRELTSEPSDAGLAFEDVHFTSEDGIRLHGWWIPAEGARATVLFCHGNGGNIGTRVSTIEALHGFGVHVFVFDYRGYGRSRGIPTERGTRRDARAAYEVVRARYHDQDAPPVILYGRSLGGAVAMQLACDRPTLGVIVESAFSSMLDMAAHLYPLLPYRWFGRYRFDTARTAAQVKVPKLIAHSAEDELIPEAMGREIFAAAAEPKKYVALRGTHAEPGWLTNPSYHETLRTFVRELAGYTATQ